MPCVGAVQCISVTGRGVRGVRADLTMSIGGQHSSTMFSFSVVMVTVFTSSTTYLHEHIITDVQDTPRRIISEFI